MKRTQRELLGILRNAAVPTPFHRVALNWKATHHLTLPSKIELSVQNKNLAIQIMNSDYRENAD